MSQPNSATAASVAQWMLDELNRVQFLYQEQVVYDIQSRFGDSFVYTNDSGNPAIAKPVLAAFNKLTGDAVVWERGERMWRRRADYDSPGRQQS